MTKAKVINKPGAAQQSQLARAFDVINALINATQPMKLKALAEVTRLDASGTLRLLKTLIELGYVIRIESTKSYLPSVKALFPIGLYHPIQELRRDAAQLLIEIQQTCDVTSALQIFLGGQRVVIDQRHNSSRLTPFWNTTITSPFEIFLNYKCDF
jgi:DNA-binding IclR family transcriptional regulator